MILTGLILGVVLGAVLQRGRFCVTGFLRDIYLRRTFGPFVALLIVISVQALGVQILSAAGIIHPDYDPFAPWAVIGGSVLFGIGIVLAGGCASGTWYRAGEGLVGSWIALAGYATAAAAMKTGALRGVNDWGRSVTTTHVSPIHDFGINPWLLSCGLGAVTAVWAAVYVRRGAGAAPPRLAGLPGWQRPLPLYVAAVAVGLIGVAAWPLSAATGRNDGLGITTPSKNVVNFLVTGESEFLDWGALLVLGILLGSLVAARVSGEFRVRVPDARTAVAALAGGILMGVGASWAGGCTVGNGMVQTSLFSYQGWTALLFTALGVFLAAKFYLLRGTRATAAQAAPTQAQAPAQLAAEHKTPGATTAPEQQASAAGARAEHGLEFAARIAPLTHTPVLEAAPRHAAPQRIAPQRRAPAYARGGVALAEEPVAEEDWFVLDTVGDVCPFPLLKLRQAVDALPAGAYLTITFDCTQATEAIPSWAATAGHRVHDFHRLGPASWSLTLQVGAAADD
ncbi:hypothetical protein C1Y63_00860 [Corynebacterium sp. 13CS0277]|uniref:YeeE/YedE thiosulfate transporter family protein n=1 Tax=Corynebacterium sp. 13CS0277 TaxID=2071994 RepID=UPI000D026A43|nr:YeeE/YedE thiosulfate transporter family protein [Corynebacterium sp. 13CS0277]PRQ12376.1 hypothetical protein C1Y63_00860 [Corynebacterium sp. 13CS0277]